MKMRRISPDWGLNEFTEGFSYLLSLLILTRSLHIGPISHYTDKEAEAQRNLLRTVEWGSQGSCMQAPASLSHVRTCTHTEKRFLWSLCPDRDKRRVGGPGLCLLQGTSGSTWDLGCHTLRQKHTDTHTRHRHTHGDTHSWDTQTHSGKPRHAHRDAQTQGLPDIYTGTPHTHMQ